MEENFGLKNVNTHIQEQGLPPQDEMRTQIETNQRSHHIAELAQGLIDVSLSSAGGALFFSNYLNDINRYAEGHFDQKYETQFADWSVADFKELLNVLEIKMKSIKD
jgi:hypothetical protein